MKFLNARFVGALVIGVYLLYAALTPLEPHLIDAANLIFHEAGHTLFIFFGEFIHILMGSGFQVLLPLLIAIYFFWKGKYYEGAVCGMWVGENLVNVSVYAGDAIVMQLPLLGGDSVYHDWHYLLSSLHILAWTNTIATTLSTLGLTTILGCLVLACYFAATEEKNAL